MKLSTCTFTQYGVATVSNIDEIIGLFCRLESLLQGSCSKETYDLIDPTNRSHPICVNTYLYIYIHVHTIYVNKYKYIYVYIRTMYVNTFKCVHIFVHTIYLNTCKCIYMCTHTKSMRHAHLSVWRTYFQVENNFLQIKLPFILQTPADREEHPSMREENTFLCKR